MGLLLLLRRRLQLSIVQTRRRLLQKGALKHQWLSIHTTQFVILGLVMVNFFTTGQSRKKDQRRLCIMILILFISNPGLEAACDRHHIRQKSCPYLSRQQTTLDKLGYETILPMRALA
jgi:hypothetical protein